LLTDLTPPFFLQPPAPGGFLFPADAINAALRFVTANYSAATDAVKHAALFYYLLPLKIGLSQAVTPFSWGKPKRRLGVWRRHVPRLF